MGSNPVGLTSKTKALREILKPFTFELNFFISTLLIYYISCSQFYLVYTDVCNLFDGAIMKLVEAHDVNRLNKIQDLYNEAFPLAERKSFSLLLKTRDSGQAEILSIENENNDFLGLAITAQYLDLVLLDYFAIASTQRGSGIGSKVFQLLKQRYADKRFFLEIERTDVPADNQLIRQKRKAFYLKHGMKNAPFMVNLCGVEMEILAHDCELSFQDYFNLYHSLFGAHISRYISLAK